MSSAKLTQEDVLRAPDLKTCIRRYGDLSYRDKMNMDRRLLVRRLIELIPLSPAEDVFNELNMLRGLLMNEQMIDVLMKCIRTRPDWQPYWSDVFVLIVNATNAANKNIMLLYVQELIDLGVDVNRPDRGRTLPLHTASDPSVTHLLLLHGADPNLQTRHGGNTPLHSTVLEEPSGTATHLILQLILAGADVNLQNNDGDTPLHLAYRGYIEFEEDREELLLVILILQTHGARTDIENNQGEIVKETDTYLQEWNHLNRDRMRELNEKRRSAKTNEERAEIENQMRREENAIQEKQNGRMENHDGKILFNQVVEINEDFEEDLEREELVEIYHDLLEEVEREMADVIAASSRRGNENNEKKNNEAHRAARGGRRNGCRTRGGKRRGKRSGTRRGKKTHRRPRDRRRRI